MPQAEVMLLRFGSSFKLVCPDCRKVLAKNIASEHAAYAHGSAVVQHVAQCEGVRNTWLRQLRSVFAARRSASAGMPITKRFNRGASDP